MSCKAVVRSDTMRYIIITVQYLRTIAADVMNDALVALDKVFAAERIVCRTVLQLHGAYIVTVISISTRYPFR